MINELQAAVKEIQKYAKEYLDEYLDAVRDELQAALARAEEVERQRDEAWTAGAEAMREVCAATAYEFGAAFRTRNQSDYAQGYEAASDTISTAIRALPIPAQAK